MSPVLIAFFTTFIDLLGFGIIIPIQPFYAQSFGMSPTWITLLGASYSLMQFLFSSKVGRLSDRIGRRPVMLGCVSLLILGYFLFAIADSIFMLFVARMICGVGGSNLGAAQAIIADSTSPEKRAKGMGLIGAAFGLGFIFGPALGGILGQYGPTIPIFACAFLSILNFLMILFFLPETRKLDEDSSSKPHSISRRSSLSHWKSLTQLPNLGALFAISLSFTFAFALMEQTISLYIEDIWVKGFDLSDDEHFKKASAYTAYFLILVGVAATIIQGGLIGRLTQRFGEIFLCRLGIMIARLSFLLIIFVGRIENYELLLGVAFLMAMGTGVLHPCRASLLSKGAPLEFLGSALGMNQSLSALGRVIGPAIAGVLFESSIELPFWVGASCMIISLYFAFTLQELKKDS